MGRGKDERLVTHSFPRLPSRGSAIKAIDITEDGSLVLCTTKTFLLVFPTTTSSGRSAFTGHGLGKEKPPQYQLRLSFEHVRELGEVDFTPAKFNASKLPFVPFCSLLFSALSSTSSSFLSAHNLSQGEAGDSIRSIVTSTGPYVITWSFTYHNGQLVISDEYKMRGYHQNVIAEEFRRDSKRDIVVLLPNDVTLAKKNRRALFRDD